MLFFLHAFELGESLDDNQNAHTADAMTISQKQINFVALSFILIYINIHNFFLMSIQPDV